MQHLEKSPKELGALIKYMDPVTQSKEKLDGLGTNWDTLSLLSQLGDAGMNMDKIKGDFLNLSSELIEHFGSELLDKIVSEMNSKAQVCVDIVIRNLFERTADIGFLATDEAIKKFLVEFPTPYKNDYKESAALLRKRFIEYAKKYSVYFDIILMNPQGDILATAQSNGGVVKSHDTILQEVRHTNAEYVESFKYHDFLPHCQKSLVYSYKVAHAEKGAEEVLGVLCLCFKFEDEMQGIFSNLIEASTKESLLLLDKNGKVIASSDIYHIPLGAPMEIVQDAPYKIVTFGGRDYLAKSAQTKGYQGFFGLGWYGHIMIPLEHAFHGVAKEDFGITQSLLLAILQHSDLFSETLKRIPLQAANIQHNLNRAIWNGNVKQNNSHNDNKQFSKALLREIHKTGEQTKSIIADSMAKLTKTMVLSDSVFLADLILDIMDRNLYERANDARWWALTPDFETILETQNRGQTEHARINSVLKHINSLYTVYTNLFVFDTKGIIVGVSQASANHLIGTRVAEKWVDETLQLDDTSKYCVSDFAATPLYNNEHTYIYGAAIRSKGDASKVVGGIGIVFDSKLQFTQMIEESLPKKETKADKEALFCVLASQDTKIIATNKQGLETGAPFMMDRKFFMLQNGESMSEIIAFEGDYYAVGVKCSKGYREYKSLSDSYENNVYCFIFSYISNVAQTRVSIEESAPLKEEIIAQSDEESIEIATFMIGSKWLGVRTQEVVEALSIVALSSTIQLDSEHHFKGTMIYKESVVSVIDIQNFIQEKHNSVYEEIIVLKFGENGYIGILVNSLSTIPTIKKENIRPLDEYVIGNGTLIQSIVFPTKGAPSSETLSIINIEKIQRNLVQPNLTHMNRRG